MTLVSKYSACLAVALLGCSGAGAASDATSEREDDEPDVPEPVGEKLTVQIAADQPTLINLERLEVVAVEDPGESLDWDLAFQGFDIASNSGPSGPGMGAAFGPSDPLDFFFAEEDGPPDAPFLRADAPGGAFLDWYAYDDTTHALWPRYHVYGIKDGDQSFKLQLLSYYGEEFGAPVSALYRMRYAEVESESIEQTEELANLDATAGGPTIDPTKPSGCLNLQNGDVLLLSPEEALESTEWHLCFRRDAISVNGGLGGPGAVTAVDLSANETADETLEQVQERTAESELLRFDEVDYDALLEAADDFRADRSISAFGKSWFEGQGEELRAVDASWFVRSADGARDYLLLLSDLEGNDESATRLTLQIRPLTEGE